MKLIIKNWEVIRNIYESNRKEKYMKSISLGGML